MQTDNINYKERRLNLDQYDTDKISNEYLDIYDPILKPWIGKKISLLELGIFNGGSLRLWSDYFPKSNIVGVDINLPKDFQPSSNIHMYQGDQTDIDFLSQVSSDMAPEGFDIIIDDAAHVGALSKISFWHLFDNHLRPGGLYVIEDWGTGYWEDWPDGKGFHVRDVSYKLSIISNFFRKIRIALFLYLPHYIARILAAPFASRLPSHSYGMVGLVKQLVDEQSANNVTRRKISGKASRKSKFEKMIITPSIVFIIKAHDQ